MCIGIHQVWEILNAHSAVCTVHAKTDESYNYFLISFKWNRDWISFVEFKKVLAVRMHAAASMAGNARARVGVRESRGRTEKRRSEGSNDDQACTHTRMHAIPCRVDVPRFKNRSGIENKQASKALTSTQGGKVPTDALALNKRTKTNCKI